MHRKTTVGGDFMKIVADSTLWRRHKNLTMFSAMSLPMRFRIIYGTVAALILAGCRSDFERHTEAVITMEKPATPDAQTFDSTTTNASQSELIQTTNGLFKVESIPNPELSATSREGDNRPAIYSKNIVAVYAVGTNEVDVAITNAPPKTEK
jgi:hypothetical protein